MKSDRRTRYTKMVIKDSLLSLMQEKTINKITVSELCAKAEINRGTFYAHYKSPIAVYKQIEESLYNDVKASLTNALEDMQLSTLLYQLLLLIKKNKELCLIIFNEYSDSTLLQDILFMAQDLLMKEWLENDTSCSESELQYSFQFLAHGCIGVIKLWFKTGMKEDVKTILEILLNQLSQSMPNNRINLK